MGRAALAQEIDREAEYWQSAAVLVRYPNVPIVFCENRRLAEEWAYRFLGASAAYADEESVEL